MAPAAFWTSEAAAVVLAALWSFGCCATASEMATLELDETRLAFDSAFKGSTASLDGCHLSWSAFAAKKGKEVHPLSLSERFYLCLSRAVKTYSCSTQLQQLTAGARFGDARLDVGNGCFGFHLTLAIYAR